MGTFDECLTFMFSERLRLDRLTPLCTVYVAALALHVLCGIYSRSEDAFGSECMEVSDM